MEPYKVSLNQVNFDKQTLEDGGDEIESFANIVSYEDDFKSHNSYPIESKKVYFENDNGLYLQQERLDSLKNNMQYLHNILNKNEGIISKISHDDLPNSFKAFTEATDALHLQETIISSPTLLASLESTNSKLSTNINKNGTTNESQNITQFAFQLDSHPTPPLNQRKKKSKNHQNLVEVIVHNQLEFSSNHNLDCINHKEIVALSDIKSESIKQNLTNFIEPMISTTNNESTNLNFVNNNYENIILNDKNVEHHNLVINDYKEPHISNDIQTIDRKLNNINEFIQNETLLNSNDKSLHIKNCDAQSVQINITEYSRIEDNLNHIYFDSKNSQKENNYIIRESEGFKSWDLERAHLIGRLDMLEAELKLVLTERSSLKTKVASLEEQLKIFGSTAEDRDALCVDLETMRINQSRLEGVIVEAHTLLNDRNLEIQQLNAAINQMTEQWETMQAQILYSKRSVESREAISIDLKAKITELYIELQLTNQKNLLTENQMTSIEGDLKAANATKQWFKDQLEQTEKDVNELREELTSVRGKYIQRGTELEKSKAELARSKRLIVDTEQRLLSEKQLLVAYLERIESEMMQRDAQQDAANRTYLHFIEHRSEENDVEIKKEETVPPVPDLSIKVTELESIKNNLEKRIEHYEQVLNKREDLEKKNSEKIIELDQELNVIKSQMEFKNYSINQLEKKCHSLETDLSNTCNEKRFIDESMIKLKSDLKLIDQNFSSMKEELRKKQLHNEKLTTQVDLLVKELDSLKAQKQRTKSSGFEILREIHVPPNFNFQGTTFNDSSIQAEMPIIVADAADELKIISNLNFTDRNEESISEMQYNHPIPVNDVVRLSEESKIIQNVTKSLNNGLVMIETDTQTDVDKVEYLIFPFSKDFKYSSVAVQTNVVSYINKEMQATDVEENHKQICSVIDNDIPFTHDLSPLNYSNRSNISQNELIDTASNTTYFEKAIIVKDMTDVGIETMDIYLRNLRVIDSEEKSKIMEDGAEMYLIDSTYIQTNNYLNNLKFEEPPINKRYEKQEFEVPLSQHTNHSVKFIITENSQDEIKGIRTDATDDVAPVHGNHWLPEWERLLKFQNQLENDKIKIDKDKLIIKAQQIEYNNIVSRFDLLTKDRDNLDAQLKSLNLQFLNLNHVKDENHSLLDKLSNLTVDNDNLKEEIKRMHADQNQIKSLLDMQISEKVNEEKRKWEVERTVYNEKLTNDHYQEYLNMKEQYENKIKNLEANTEMLSKNLNQNSTDTKSQYELQIALLKDEREGLLKDMDNLKEIYLSEIDQCRKIISNLNVNLIEYDTLIAKFNKEKLLNEENILRYKVVESNYKSRIDELQLENQQLKDSIESLKLEYESKYLKDVNDREVKLKEDIDALNIKYEIETTKLNDIIIQLNIQINNNDTHFHGIKFERDNLALELERTKGMLDGMLGSQLMLREHATKVESSLANKESTEFKQYSQLVEEVRLRNSELTEAQDQIKLLEECQLKLNKQITDLKNQLLLEKASNGKLREDFNRLQLRCQQLEVEYSTAVQEKEVLILQSISQSNTIEKHTSNIVAKFGEIKQGNADSHNNFCSHVIELQMLEKEKDEALRKSQDAEVKMQSANKQIQLLEWKLAESVAEVKSLEERICIIEERHSIDVESVSQSLNMATTELTKLRLDLMSATKECNEHRTRVVRLKEVITSILHQYNQALEKKTYLFTDHVINKEELERVLQEVTPISADNQPLDFLQATLKGLKCDIYNLQNQVTEHTNAVHHSSMTWRVLEAQVADLREICKTSAASRAGALHINNSSICIE